MMRCEARQLHRMKTMPTERSSPPVNTGRVCAMATRASRTPLLAADIDGEHEEEQCDCQQHAGTLGDPQSQLDHAAAPAPPESPRLSELATMLCSVISASRSSRRIRPW